MAGNDDQDDDIPLLEDIVRPGQGEAARSDPRAGPSQASTSAAGREQLPLSDAEIEAIAARVVERHIGTIEQAVARAIRAAIRLKHHHKGGGAGSDVD